MGFSNFKINVGMVSIPVSLESGIANKTSSNKCEIHKCDNGEIGKVGRKKYCKKCEKELEWNGNDKGYEVNSDEIIPLNDETIENAKKLAQISSLNVLGRINKDVVKTEDEEGDEEFDIRLIRKFYYLDKQEGFDKQYLLLKKGLQRRNEVMVCKYPYRDDSIWFIGIMEYKGDLVVFRFHNPNLIKDFNTEIEADVSEENISKMEKLLDSLEKYNPYDYTDKFEQKLKQVVDKKMNGEEVKITEEEVEMKEEKNLDEALDKSLENLEESEKEKEAKPKVEV